MQNSPVKAVLYGAGSGGKRILAQLPTHIEIVAVVDGDPSKHGSFLFGHVVCPPDCLNESGI
jgi:FlaA1/EpsC-like NDP-sugar epimerase